ncbi:methylenetetrahydrofolate reductase [Rhizobium sp. FKY42]|uniref:methylenetetrahydrofolate reductase n=1 Tax=Rhizobium sp. FKY42 TaxID=2562310 RepID=UPI0010BF91C8|nr:methylenetetrahydrofolate reductase [Rhizobium sp. FKY42]
MSATVPAVNTAEHLPVSIEISATKVLKGDLDHAPLAAESRVYIPDLGSETLATRVAAARHIRALGLRAVPHLAARRLPSTGGLTAFLDSFTQEAGVRDLLLIAGSPATATGPFGSSMQVLATGALQTAGITNVGVAGHPEGSPDFDTQTAERVLLEKLDYLAGHGLTARIVTQFGFDPVAYIDWAHRLRARGILAPVHVGLAGPAKLTTLIKYGVACGVGNSLQFLKTRTSNLRMLASGFDPGDIVDAIQSANLPAIAGLHFYPFGGTSQTLDWLEARGLTLEAKQ